MSTLAAQPIPVATALADVGKIAFGFYFSPNYLNTSGPAAGLITTSGNQPVPVPQLLNGLTFGYIPVSFHVFLPKTAPPPGGYPVVIYGHGLGDSQWGAPTYIASTLARNGYATVAMEITGHGYGSNGTITVVDSNGKPNVLASSGRGVLLPGNSTIGESDGCIAPGPFAIRDCSRQTAVDVYALMKTIQRSGGLGLSLNGQKISYVGQSFGSIYGTLLQAVAPDLQMAVLNAGGGPFVDVARLALNGRPLGGLYLCGLGLLNVPANSPPNVCLAEPFNDNYVFRDQDPVVNNVPGALPEQAAFEAAEWIGMLGDAAAYAPYLHTVPLPGNQPKNTLFQFGVGDLEVPNPANVTLIKAADAQNTSSVFQFPEVYANLAAITDPNYRPAGMFFPILPHRILSNPTIFDYPTETPISIAEQEQVAAYFRTGGTSVPDANKFLKSTMYNGAKLFDGASTLGNTLNYSIPQ